MVVEVVRFQPEAPAVESGRFAVAARHLQGVALKAVLGRFAVFIGWVCCLWSWAHLKVGADYGSGYCCEDASGDGEAEREMHLDCLCGMDG